MSIEVQWLGRVGYEETLALQERLVAGIANARGDAIENQKSEIRNSETLLLLEHDAVYTIGRTRDQSSLGDRAALPHPVVEINRGGQATWHGPGQLVGYPILDLQNRGRDLHRYLRALELVLIETLREYDIDAEQRASLTGVWVGAKKIASIGVGVRHWITMHGFALNVCGDLAAFQHITPCGIAGVEITSIERETGRSVNVKTVAEKVGVIFLGRFDEMLAAKGGQDSVEPHSNGRRRQDSPFAPEQTHLETHPSRPQDFGSTVSRPLDLPSPKIQPLKNESVGRKHPASGVLISLHQPTIVFVTTCTRDRKPWLANGDAHRFLREAWAHSEGWLVGRYVLMPDHLHFFCAPQKLEFSLAKWMTFWKRSFTRLAKNTEWKFQTGHWDTRLRREENYEQKWSYVRENPVRASLVARAEDWSYQGEMNFLPW